MAARPSRAIVDWRVRNWKQISPGRVKMTGARLRCNQLELPAQPSCYGECREIETATRGCLEVLSLADISRIVWEAVHTLEPPMEVVAVTPGGHDGDYAEVILSVDEGSADPRRFIVGIERGAPADVLRRTVSGDVL